MALVGEFESHHHLASGFRGAANTGKGFTPFCYELEKWISEAVSFMFSCKPWRFSVQQASAPFEIPIQVRLKKNHYSDKLGDQSELEAKGEPSLLPCDHSQPRLAYQPLLPQMYMGEEFGSKAISESSSTPNIS